MLNTTSFDFADIVLVPFPFTDQSTTRKRPAVVVSSDAYHRQPRAVILMAITSQFRTVTTVGEVAVQQWEAAGLLKPSVLKPLLAIIEKQGMGACGHVSITRQFDRVGSPDITVSSGPAWRHSPRPIGGG
jgi:mRNA interferase MazF